MTANDGTSTTPQVLFPMLRCISPSCPHADPLENAHEFRTIQYAPEAPDARAPSRAS